MSPDNSSFVEQLKVKNNNNNNSVCCSIKAVILEVSFQDQQHKYNLGQC